MKTALVSLLALVAGASLASAQRITGDSSCVNACYQISVSVTQCPDLTDSGVISCICPNSSQVAQLDQCHGCISSLTGVTDLETNSINTLYNACQSNSTSASGASSAAPSSSGIGSGSGTIGAGNAAQTSQPAGAAFHSASIAGILTVGVAAVAAFVTL